MEKIFHSAEAKIAPATAEPPAVSPAEPATAQPTTTTSSVAPAGTATSSTQPVDVEAVLTAMAEKKAGGNWQTSIVDLLKLLDLDSNLAARKQLATELNVHVGADGSADENIALHKAVMQKLADNGGKVPDSLKV